MLLCTCTLIKLEVNVYELKANKKKMKIFEINYYYFLNEELF